MYVLIDAPTVTVSLISSGEPQSVQVVLNPIPVGVDYSLVGSASDGSTWPVPGGVGVGTGEQVEFVDNRAPLNVPVTYVLTVGGASYESLPVTVAFDGRYILQSLDGALAARFWLIEDGLPREYTVRSTAFDVPGRRRPPVRFSTGGAGGGRMTLRTAREGSAAIESMLGTGRPLVLRTEGNLRDLAPVEILLPTGASNVLSRVAAIDSRRTDRVWSLSYLLVDDPEPSTPLSIFTWEDFDAAMDRLYAAGGTFDGLFSASTWDDFNTYDWDQV